MEKKHLTIRVWDNSKAGIFPGYLVQWKYKDRWFTHTFYKLGELPAARKAARLLRKEGI